MKRITNNYSQEKGGEVSCRAKLENGCEREVVCT